MEMYKFYSIVHSWCLFGVTSFSAISQTHEKFISFPFYLTLENKERIASPKSFSHILLFIHFAHYITK